MEHKVFPQMNTLVRMREGTLLSKQQKSELIGAENLETAFNLLIGTGFFTYARPAHLSEFEKALETERQSSIRWCREMAPKIPVAEIFEVPDILHNLKVFLRERLIGVESADGDGFAGLYLDRQSRDKSYFVSLLKADIAELSHDDLSIKKVIEEAQNDYAVHSSFLRVDLIIAFFGHARLLALSEKINEPKITDFIKAYIDLNLLSIIFIIFQTRENADVLNKTIISKAVTSGAGLDAEKLFFATANEQDELMRKTVYSGFWQSLKNKTAQSLSEVYADNYLMKLCGGAKLEAFGVYPLFAFLYAKLLDIKNIRVIFALKKAEANSREIEERLRAEYGI